MKRIVAILAVVCCCTFLTGAAFAVPTYDMNVIGGQVFGTATAITDLNNALLGSFVLPGGGTFAVPDFTTALPGPGSAVTGYWTFDVSFSSADTGSPNWNDVMAGGTWLFSTDWTGALAGISDPLSAEFNVVNTFGNIYGQWAMNNSHMYTLFGLFTDPAAGPASTPGAVSPVGLFAFAGDASSSFDLTLLQGNDFTVTAGEGSLTATPEPATMLLFGVGLVGIAGLGKKKLFKK